LAPRYDAQGKQIGVIQILEDITAQKRGEALRKRQLRYERALAQCSQLLLQTPADDEQQLQILNEALAHLVTGAQVGRVYIFRNFRDPELGNCLGIVAEACAPGVRSHLTNPFNRRAPWSVFPEAMHLTLQAGQTIGGAVAELWRDVPDIRDVLLGQPLLSVQFFPICFGERWWGFIGFDDLETVRQWDAEEITLSGTASEIFSGAMQRWQAERALQKERDELEARVQVRTAVLERRLQMERVLATTAERLMAQEDFGAAIEQTLQEVGELVDAAVTLLVRIDVTKRSILAIYRWQAPDIPEMPFVSGPAEDWIRRQVHTREPLYLHDVENDVEDEVVREALLKLEMRAIALYPLVVEGDIAGVFHVRLRHVLTEDDADDTLAMLDVMANLLNGLLQRQVLLENLEQRVLERTRELAAVLDIAMLDVEAIELADVVKPVLSLISELTHSQAVSVHLLTDDGTMQLAAQQGLPMGDPEHQASLQTPAHLADWLQAKGDPILATTADALAMLPYPQASSRFDAGLAVQIGGGNRPQGILACYRQGRESFSLNQLALVAALADRLHGHHHREPPAAQTGGGCGHHRRTTTTGPRSARLGQPISVWRHVVCACGTGCAG
jgi:GAF domain-containing protein